MNKIFSTLLVASFLIPGFAGSDDWHTDFKAAQELAKKEGKPILMNFSGSDWCGWCIRLDNEVFSSSVFKDFAKDNLVLLELDFPRKTPQSEEIKAQNKQLAEKYSVRGFPTVLMIDAEGKIILQTGYRRGGSALYVEHLKEALPKI